ncbi:MAG: hypothetical protein LBH91_08970 [Prevotellaceae bacterium]|jgi:hypothetical protein|nr:hypothetical protein [Prevotellaceae bacterium]
MTTGGGSMFKIRLILSICLMLFCITLVDLASDKGRAYTDENTSSGKTTPIKNQLSMVLGQVETEDSSLNGRFDLNNYDQYLKKIWVVKCWNGGAYNYPFSFFITKIENNLIEGKIATCEVAYPDCFYYRLDHSQYLGDLSGTITNGIAECYFNSLVGNNGNVKIDFKENDEIEATIKYTDISEFYKGTILNGKYLFKPFNLADVKNIDPSKKRTFAVDLDLWGTVYIATVVIAGNKPYPAVYLINMYDDILYEFTAPFQVGTEIIDVLIEDFNDDGLKDAKITSDYKIEWIFYQMDNGLFYNNKLNLE